MEERRRKRMDDEEEVSLRKQKDVGLGINLWLQDPGSVEIAVKFLSKLMKDGVFAPLGMGVFYAVISLAALGTLIAYLLGKFK